nr:FCD domain-containing protein [Ammoniphilus sp. YIM 78166]
MSSTRLRQNAAYMDEENIKRLNDCITTNRNVTIVMKANEEFHDIIVQASHNPVMVDIIDCMQSIIYLFRKTVSSITALFSLTSMKR